MTIKTLPELREATGKALRELTDENARLRELVLDLIADADDVQARMATLEARMDALE